MLLAGCRTVQRRFGKEGSIMTLDRREFLKLASAATATTTTIAADAIAASHAPDSTTPDPFAVLVDIPNCIGCRKCEFACQKAAGFDTPPIESFDDLSVFEAHRRPHPKSYTTVNRFPNPDNAAKPVYVKANCLHCLDPACASACLVGALRKQPDGAVTYDPNKCMGCRYCMVACPFQIPAYDYDNPLTPQVRKCTFCHEKISRNGGVPACVQICPNDALIFGKRSELLTLARERIRAKPDVYIDHIYGEYEAGGTTWLYLSSMPFEKLGFLNPGTFPPHRLTEAIQHGVFKFFVPPLALYALLGLVMRLTRPESKPTEQPSPTRVHGPRRGGDPPAITRRRDTGAATSALPSAVRTGWKAAVDDLQEVGT